MKMILPVSALLLTGCMTSYHPEEFEAVRDFVSANELAEVGQIRLFGQLHFTYVNDYFVTVPSRRANYLVEFHTQCRSMRRSEFTTDMVDIRADPSIIRAKFDTIRGCRIGKIYEITSEQRLELEHLGDAPGEEEFLPAEQDTE